MNGCRQRRPYRLVSCVSASVGVLTFTWAAGLVTGGVTILPANNGKLGGTLADGGPYGSFDGVADEWDWTFNGFGGFEGVLTLSRSGATPPLEQRIVWEFDASILSATVPFIATLSFSLRGPPIYPFPDVTVEIYAYPADLQEQASDFGAGPADLVGAVVVAPFEERSYRVDITQNVINALRTADGRLGLRFQLAANAPLDSAQAFMDAVDSDDATKPRIDVVEVALGDGDGNGVIDLADFARLPSCMYGPDVTPDGPCTVYDFDLDGDVDSADVARFIAVHSR